MDEINHVQVRNVRYKKNIGDTMRESIQMIKWGGVASLLFLILTYIFSVYSKVDVVIVSEVWLPKDFFMAVSSGIFASLLVVVFCEIRRYFSLKSEIEKKLFCHNTTLFTALKVLKITIEDYIKHKEWVVPENILDKNIEIIQGEMSYLQTVGYITFTKSKKSLLTEYELFQKRLLDEQSIIQAGTKLKLCMQEIRIDYLKIQEEYLKEKFDKEFFDIQKPVYTSENPKISNILENISINIDSVICAVDGFNISLDAYRKNRFNWSSLKKNLVNSRFEDAYRTDS